MKEVRRASLAFTTILCLTMIGYNQGMMYIQSIKSENRDHITDSQLEGIVIAEICILHKVSLAPAKKQAICTQPRRLLGKKGKIHEKHAARFTCSTLGDPDVRSRGSSTLW